MNHCSNCGKANKDQARFCAQCSTKDDTRKFLMQFQINTNNTNKVNKHHFFAQRISAMAGGLASETIMEDAGMKQKCVVLVVRQKVLFINCHAHLKDFDKLDLQVFQPMLESIKIK